MPLRRILLAATLTLTAAAQAPPAQTTAIAPTLSLGEPMRTTKLESDDEEIKYQNGFFFNFKGTGHVLIRDKDGHITGDFELHAQEISRVLNTVPAMHDVAIFKDGSIVASWIYTLPHEESNYFDLVHYDRSGNLLEQIDLGRWRALRVCIADDKSIWTLSREEERGRPVYSPDEGVLRNYKFGTGLVRAVVPRSNFLQRSGAGFPSYLGIHAAIDCSGDKIHVLTNDGKWIEYTPGADFTITPVEPFSHATYGDYWRMIGFAYLSGHAYTVVHSVPGDPFRRMLAELLPSADGKMLRWTEIQPDNALPGNNAHTTAATNPLGQSPDQSSAYPKEPIAVTGILGTDHEDGEELIYRTSKDETLLWSRPVFATSPHSAQ